MKKTNPLIIIRFLVFNGFELISGNKAIKEKSALHFETQVNNVKVTFSDYFKKNLINYIRPAPESKISYENIECYPEQRFTYIIGMGLKGKELFTYLLKIPLPLSLPPQKKFIYCFGS
ncbi:hypothetical protein AYK20_04035 [Thermoplasmatales archaeon SG8-52-1]|nr:MAG: hypothetical protein AYK20_04035 [Thermoplasmatales archaeon SG8-52-1]